jgi:hypothetical protein
MANYANDAASTAFESGRPSDAAYQALHREYNAIASIKGNDAAKVFLNDQTSKLVASGLLPDMGSEWAREKATSEGGQISYNELNQTSQGNNGADYFSQVMAKQVFGRFSELQNLTGEFMTDGLSTGAFNADISDFDSAEVPKGADSALNSLLASDETPVQQATVKLKEATVSAQQSTAAQVDATSSQLTATADIPTNRPLTIEEAADLAANRQAQGQDVAAVNQTVAATKVTISADKQLTGTADTAIANNGIQLTDGVVINPGVNAISSGKISLSSNDSTTTPNGTNSADSTTPSTARNTSDAAAPISTNTDAAAPTNNTSDATNPLTLGDSNSQPGASCDATTQSGYIAKRGDSFWSIAAGLLKVPNDKEHASEILKATKQLMALNSGIKAGRLQIGAKVNTGLVGFDNNNNESELSL